MLILDQISFGVFFFDGFLGYSYGFFGINVVNFNKGFRILNYEWEFVLLNLL